MRPQVLYLSAPAIPSPLLSGREAVIPIPYSYALSGTLTFSLVEGASGMSLDPREGVIRWTPPPAAEGSSVRVRVDATDGNIQSSVSFQLRVAESSPLPVTVDGRTLTITGTGNLRNVAFTIPSDATVTPSSVAAYRIDPDDAPKLPDGLTRLTDFFRLTPLELPRTPLTVTIPAELVPTGRLPEALRLLVHTDATTEAVEREWLRVWRNLDVSVDGSITIAISVLGELFTIAIVDESESVTDPHLSVSEASAVCVPLRLSNGAQDLRRQVCTVAGEPALTFAIKDHGRAAWASSTSPAEIADWLALARTKSEETGLVSGTSLEVVIEPLGEHRLGFVSAAEGYEVLHLNASAMPKAMLQGTVVHEFFHHAQSLTSVDGQMNLIRRCGRDCNWLTEGTARWFEDLVFDELDTYRLKELEPLPPVLLRGLDAWPDERIRDARPYARFAFFKLLSSRCPKLDLADAVNAELAFDPTGVDSLLQSVFSWDCHFADGLAGAWSEALPAAMLEYTYATIGENSMPMLDGDEAPFDFQNSYDTIHPDAACKAAGSCPSWAARSGVMHSVSTRAVRVEAVDRLANDTEAALVLRSNSGTLVAWVGNDEEGTLDDGTWIEIDGTVVHPYSKAGRAPRMLVILVNPDAFTEEAFEIRSILRNSVPGAAATPFDFAWSYQPADPVREKYLIPHVTWNATVTGSVTAPESVAVTNVTRPYQWANMRVMQACAPNTSAFTIGMEATLAAASAQLQGRAPHPTIPNAFIEWRYSNPHLMVLLNEPTGSVSGGTVSFAIPVVKNAFFGKDFGACLAYDLEQWTINPDGSRSSSGTQTDLCQTTVVLDLRVGSPPPGCP